jgi:hypothetical protein
MAVLRWLSLVLLVLALMLLGADAVDTIELRGNGTVVRPLDMILMLFGIDAAGWVRAHAASWLVEPGLAILSAPGWVSIGIPGVLLSLLPGRKPAKPLADAQHAPPIER